MEISAPYFRDNSRNKDGGAVLLQPILLAVPTQTSQHFPVEKSEDMALLWVDLALSCSYP